MKLLTEISTRGIKELQDFNQEIRQRLSSMHSCTEQEMQRLDKWLEEAKKMEQDLRNASLLINLHLSDLERKLRELQRKASSKD